MLFYKYYNNTIQTFLVTSMVKKWEWITKIVFVFFISAENI